MYSWNHIPKFRAAFKLLTAQLTSSVMIISLLGNDWLILRIRLISLVS